MATSEKNILITPNIGQTSDPTIVFSGASVTANAANITATILPTSNGTLAFSGTAGQLFSITNSLTGTLFSVNDISGIPSIEVLDTGTIKLAQYSGNIGVGTANPTAKLDIGSGNLTFSNTTTGQRITGDFSNATIANRLMFQTSTVNGSTGIMALPNGTSTSGAAWRAANTSNTANCSTVEIFVGTTDARLVSSIYGTGSYLPLTFYTAATERMRIDSSGNVGIGTTTTTGTRLSVTSADTVNALGLTSGTGSLTYGAFSGANFLQSAGGTFTIGTIGANDLIYRTNSTEQMRITSAGNVGIGTTSPRAPLAFSTSAGTAGEANKIRTFDDGSVTVYGIGISSFQQNYVVASGGSHCFYVGNLGSATERMRIHSSGGVSIGNTTDPGATNLSVTGSITTAGSLGIGTAASGTAGEIRATNAVTAFYSDIRLKENIKPIENALDKVNSISGVTYNSNQLAETFGYTDKSEQVGVLAQELEKVLPHVVKLAPFDTKYIDGKEVSVSGENYKTVQYEKIIPLLVEAIKELNEKVKKLEGK
jgi:hypothetical protein